MGKFACFFLQWKFFQFVYQVTTCLFFNDCKVFCLQCVEIIIMEFRKIFSITLCYIYGHMISSDGNTCQASTIQVSWDETPCTTKRSSGNYQGFDVLFWNFNWLSYAYSFYILISYSMCQILSDAEFFLVFTFTFSLASTFLSKDKRDCLIFYVLTNMYALGIMTETFYW